MSKEFGDRLRSRRKECEMTTTACAAALGVTQPAWNQWELGIREPKLDMLIKVATRASHASTAGARDGD